MKIFSFLQFRPLQVKKNPFLQYHNFLKENDPHLFSETVALICEILMIPTVIYYDRLVRPEKYTGREKQAIGCICRMPAHFLFPELEKESGK